MARHGPLLAPIVEQACDESENGIANGRQLRLAPRSFGARRIVARTVLRLVVIGAGVVLGSLTLVAFALYVVPWILKPPKLRDLAIIAGLFLAAVPIAFALDALGAPPWIALALLAATTTAYVLISEHRDERGRRRTGRQEPR